MKAICMTVVVGLALILLSPTQGQDKKDPEKASLVGVWLVEKGPIPEGSTVEFKSDGKLTITVKGEKPLRIEGTYKTDGKKLSMMYKVEGNAVNETVTIQTLTDSQLVTLDAGNAKSELKRVKTKTK